MTKTVLESDELGSKKNGSRTIGTSEWRQLLRRLTVKGIKKWGSSWKGKWRIGRVLGVVLFWIGDVFCVLFVC